MNSFGTSFRISIYGESHGIEIGVVIDGVPAGIPLCEEDFAADLDRRRSGAPGTTPRKEADIPHIVSGVFNGFTTGAPVAITFRNENTRSGDYSHLKTHPRPSHADWVANCKFGGFQDYRGGGHFSGRLTLTLVAAGVVAKKILVKRGIEINAAIRSLGGCEDKSRFDTIIEKAVRELDSVGGVVECVATGLPAGLGEPFFNSVESVISHLVFSIPAIKGLEFGAGFAAAGMSGTSHNDPIVDADGRTSTNHAGGVVGGITNGNDLVFRVAVKPTASISTRQTSFNMASGKMEELIVKGRHDACIALRVPVVLEAVTAIALMQFNG